MAKTKAKTTSELSADELQLRLRELKQEALNLRLQRATGTLENPARIRTGAPRNRASAHGRHRQVARLISRSNLFLP